MSLEKVFSKQLTQDILKYFIEIKKMSTEQIAECTGSSVDCVKNIIDKKDSFTGTHILNYLDYSHLKFFEFVTASIPLEHLPKDLSEKIIFYEEIKQKIQQKKC